MTTIQDPTIEPAEVTRTAPMTVRPPGTAATASRVGGAIGILWVVTSVVTLLARGDTPWWDDPIDTVRSYWVDHGDRYLVSQYIGSLAAVTLLSAFLVVLSTTLERRSQTQGGLPRLVLLAGGLHIVFMLGADAAWATLGSAADRLDDESILLLMSLDRGAYQAAGLTLGLFVAATAAAIITGDCFPRWLGFAGLVPAAGLFLSPLSIVDDDPDGAFVFIGFLGSLLTMLFVVALSVVLVRGVPQSRTGRAEA
jgi:hypothetical protein